jgi:hypothetical protein
MSRNDVSIVVRRQSSVAAHGGQSIDELFVIFLVVQLTILSQDQAFAAQSDLLRKKSLYFAKLLNGIDPYPSIKSLEIEIRDFCAPVSPKTMSTSERESSRYISRISDTNTRPVFQSFQFLTTEIKHHII